MCSVDWGLLGQWAQFAAILFTGCTAVYVANRQLGAYNATLKTSVETERFRNSIKVLEDIRNPVQMLGVTSTPMDAVVDLQRVIKSGGAARYSGVAKYLEQHGKYLGSKEEYEWFMAIQAKVSIVVDYYMSLIELGREGLLKGDYVSRKISAFYPIAYESLVALTGDRFKGADLEQFYNEMVELRNQRLAKQEGAASVEGSGEGVGQAPADE